MTLSKSLPVSGSLSQFVKRDHQYVPHRAEGRKGGGPSRTSEGGTKLLVTLSPALGMQRAGAVVLASRPLPPFNLSFGRRGPGSPAAPPPCPLEPRPPSDGGAAPGNGALPVQCHSSPTRPGRPRRLSQTTRQAPKAAAGTAAPGLSLGHHRTDGAGSTPGAWEAMGTWAGPAVVGRRESRV